MNILHMKYAVEVAKMGSLSKAADVLLIAQPNISRSIKELEADLGITPPEYHFLYNIIICRKNQYFVE